MNTPIINFAFNGLDEHSILHNPKCFDKGDAPDPFYTFPFIRPQSPHPFNLRNTFFFLAYKKQFNFEIIILPF